MKDYDSDLHMFRQLPQPVQLARLGFLRHLGERGKLEHPIAGPPAGPLAPVNEPAGEPQAA